MMAQKLDEKSLKLRLFHSQIARLFGVDDEVPMSTESRQDFNS